MWVVRLFQTVVCWVCRIRTCQLCAVSSWAEQTVVVKHKGQEKYGWQWQAEAEAEADKTISQSPTRQTFLRFCGWEIETKHPTKAQPCTHQDWDHIKTR